jgi:hypothetical protein
MLTDPLLIAREAEQEYAVAKADAAERVKNQMSIADATMKALLLANGGAMVALFTFVGNLVAKSSRVVPFDPTRLWAGFACFVGGLIAALLVHALAFLSQDRFYNQSMVEAWRQQTSMLTQVRSTPGEKELAIYRQGMAFYRTGFFVALISIAMFAVGCGYALSGVLAN